MIASALSLKMPVGLARGIAHDRPAAHVLHRPAHERGLERRAVREVHVSVEAVDPHRVVRGDRVDPLLARQLSAPVLMVPVAVQDPRAWRYAPCKRGNSAYELCLGLCVPQLHRLQGESTVEKMHVGVGKTRCDHRSLRVDDASARGGQFPDFGSRSDSGNTVLTDGERVGPRPAGVTGPDAGVDDSERDHGGLGEEVHALNLRPCGGGTLRRVRPTRLRRW
jgi:hypothetical protein